MIKMVKIPRMLLDHEYYKNLSDRAKVLYGILSEKMQEAERYGWIDEHGSPYVVFPKKKMQEALSCSRYRLDLVTKELVTTDLIELDYGIGVSLERRIYVHSFNERCPWIKVMYGTVMERDKPAGKDTAKDNPDVDAAMEEDTRKETDPKEDLKGLSDPDKEESGDPDLDQIGWSEVIGALVSLLSDKLPDGNDSLLSSFSGVRKRS